MREKLPKLSQVFTSMFAQVFAHLFVSVIASAFKSSVDILTGAFIDSSLNLPNSLQCQHQAQKAA